MGHDLKFQRGALSVIVGVITAHARRIGLGHLANDFCRSCRDVEEEETVPHLLGTCPAPYQRKRKYLGTYYIDDLEELSRINIGCLNRFIRSSEMFRDWGITDHCGIIMGKMRPK